MRIENIGWCAYCKAIRTWHRVVSSVWTGWTCDGCGGMPAAEAKRKGIKEINRMIERTGTQGQRVP